MTTQFIAHAEAPRTFADKKGATKAIKRDLAKHDEAHGDVLYETGFEAKQTPDGRFGVVLFCDITPNKAKTLVGPELAGYVIQPELTEEPVKAKPAAKAAQPGKRKTGEVNVAPMDSLIPARAGSKQQLIIDLLAREQGCTMDDLREVCVKRDGTTWDDNSIRSALYYDVHQKGYGVRTTFADGIASYHLVLPEGVEARLPARTPKTT